MSSATEPTRHILVVDDNPAKRCVISQILSSGGFTVVEATCGADALTLAEKQPAVIVLDVHLPDISGFEVCRRIKSAPNTSRIPVLHISGKFLSGDDRADGLEGGADAYLTEPVEPRELLATITALVRIHDAEAELVRTNQALREEIAERKRVEKALQAAIDAAKASNNAKSEFLANMSHEIRTPMTAILGYTDMLLSPTCSESDRIAYIQTIRSQGEHLLSILNDILDLSKIEAGRLTIERIPCNPAQIITEAAALMQARAVEKRLRLDATYAGPIPESIQTDPTRLRQILLNLLGNAIKFTETGGVQVIASLDPTADDASPRLRIEVIDSGIGMTPSEVAQLFDRFVQADGSTTRRFGGTGLGLIICKRLAHALGGDISCQSRPGQGSRFTVTIATGDLKGVPLRYPPADASTLSIPAPPAPSPSAETPPAPLHRGARALLAEDGVHNQQVVCFYLEQLGLDVTVVENGKLARDAVFDSMVDGRPFDLVLMDMQMPELDGYAATRALRSGGYRGPIIAITAHAMVSDREKCLEAGCTDYVPKPIDREQLSRAVQAALQHAAEPDPTASDQQPASADEQLKTHDDLDEAFRRFLPLFLSQLPGQVEQLQTAMTTSDLSVVSRVAHQLKGSAGAYGYRNVARLAARVEQCIEEREPLDAIQAQVQSLIGMIDGIVSPNHAPDAKAAQSARPASV